MNDGSSLFFFFLFSTSTGSSSSVVRVKRSPAMKNKFRIQIKITYLFDYQRIWYMSKNQLKHQHSFWKLQLFGDKFVFRNYPPQILSHHQSLKSSLLFELDYRNTTLPFASFPLEFWQVYDRYGWILHCDVNFNLYVKFLSWIFLLQNESHFWDSSHLSHLNLICLYSSQLHLPDLKL